ncbi:hypothetical protein LTR17_026098 [Elasticomyces elasticus]|nr:hypothetical protein LTR17_026098 [Elasticomyces elasticus]
MPDDAVHARLRRIEILLRRLQDSVSAKEQPQSTPSTGRPVVDTNSEAQSLPRSSHATSPPGGKLVAGRQESRFTSGGFWTELDDKNPGEDSDGPDSAQTQLADAMSAGSFEANLIISPSLGMTGPISGSMTGLATRLAVKLGLHQDPSSLGVTPLVAEMRRRLWWQVVILDVLTSEENDMDPAIHEHTFDINMPSNFNDQDLDSSMTASPPPSDGRTEMIFALQRIEISYAARKIFFPAKFAADNCYEILSMEQKSDFIDDLQRMLHEKYYRHCDPRIPLCALTPTASRLVLSRMKLTVVSSRRSGNPSPSPSNLTMGCVHIVAGIQYLHEHELHEQ